MKQTLNIVGCGKVARVLARLWHESGILAIQDIVNRSAASAQQASAFIGAGHALEALARMRAAGIYLIGTPDDSIAPLCAALAQTGKLTPESIVFHCSGALDSSALDAAAASGAALASVHPVRSFALPAQVAADFGGTCCGIEGDPRALAILGELFAAIGARLIPIRRDAKVLYHAAAVLASNYLVTLLDSAFQAYAAAGIEEDAARELLAPLAHETVENVLRVGAAAALTGPIKRGDLQTVQRQQHALSIWSPRHGDLYAVFTDLTLELAKRGKQA